MRIDLNLRDGVPIYRQIVNQVRYLIASGQLSAGQELPPIRVLAEQLCVTPNTIVKAYDALEAADLVFKRAGAGTFVADVASPLKRSEQRKLLAQRADALLSEARHLKFSFDEVVKLLHTRQAALDKHYSQEPPDERKRG